MITNLADMMVERLTAFRNKSKLLPTRIIVYRDGVSEVSVVMQSSGTSLISCLGTIRNRRQRGDARDAQGLQEV